AVTAVEHPAADRAAAYGLERILIDGNDADEVYATARRTIEAARSGAGPALVEAVTYRHGGHSRADPGKYRPEEEVKAWLARDPIPRLRSRLLEAGVDEATLATIEAEAKAKVAEAEQIARAAPEPDPATLETEVFADGGNRWRN
ncbi:MAG TPA: thiamine pyrophosphate-dependent enzyme, partial [Candidatus Binatia bacterium]|nr:thiamine pyrophosphate-dependent enzyme [Candidatus Binatia bacterium]